MKNPTSPRLRRARNKSRYLSPLTLSLLHLLPSLLLLVLIAIGFLSLMYSDNHQTVLGNQTSQPQIKTERIEDRLKKLENLGKTVTSEKAREEIDSLSK